MCYHNSVQKVQMEWNLGNCKCKYMYRFTKRYDYTFTVSIKLLHYVNSFITYEDKIKYIK